ncbi:haloacid dehalogenase [Virgisporangium aurantiacum]|uniref:Haloacid dehalogenase n=1 Tax=Virgisporangium aurantiacum TaxID=175570 RepID=A0A8J3ZGK5_9ACTN|nr:haloacid dehalogenase [Virgisporangium aurantiacum]
MLAVLFDTFGTVVDWRSGVSAAVHRVGMARGVEVDAVAFADAWRAKYEPSMKPVRDGRRPFVTLTELHRENLTATMAEFGLELPPDEVDDLNHAWERLPPWPDSVEGLTLLRERHIVGPLSNGDLGLLTRMAKRAGLPWDVIIGSDVTHRYKPQPEAYLRAAAFLDLEPAQVMLAAAHNDDLAAARRCGLSTAFIPRPTEHGPGQSRDLQPSSDWNVVATDVIDLAHQLNART